MYHDNRNQSCIFSINTRPTESNLILPILFVIRMWPKMPPLSLARHLVGRQPTICFPKEIPPPIWAFQPREIAPRSFSSFSAAGNSHSPCRPENSTSLCLLSVFPDLVRILSINAIVNVFSNGLDGQVRLIFY